MKNIIRMLTPIVALAFALSGCNQADSGEAEATGAEAAEAAASEPEPAVSETAADTAEAVDEMGRSRWTCYSGRDCTGKVLSGRDPHNCKTKSRGKSIRDSQTGQCTNL